MGDRRRQFNMPHALTTHLGERDFHAALLTHHPAVLETLVFAAETFKIVDRTKNFGAEKPLPLRFEGAVVNRFRFLDFAK